MSPESFRNPVEPEQARRLRAEREIGQGIIATRYCPKCGERVKKAGICDSCRDDMQLASGIVELRKADESGEGAKAE
jgi:hypothetical protein